MYRILRAIASTHNFFLLIWRGVHFERKTIAETESSSKKPLWFPISARFNFISRIGPAKFEHLSLKKKKKKKRLLVLDGPTDRVNCWSVCCAIARPQNTRSWLIPNSRSFRFVFIVGLSHLFRTKIFFFFFYDLFSPLVICCVQRLKMVLSFKKK